MVRWRIAVGRVRIAQDIRSGEPVVIWGILAFIRQKFDSAPAFTILMPHRRRRLDVQKSRSPVLRRENA